MSQLLMVRSAGGFPTTGWHGCPTHLKTSPEFFDHWCRNVNCVIGMRPLQYMKLADSAYLVKMALHNSPSAKVRRELNIMLMMVRSWEDSWWDISSF